MRRVGPIDLRQIQKVPDRLIWPLLRDGFDPLPRLGEVREASPVTKHTSFVGLTLWLVTGDAEAREVLANSTDFSNDIRHLVGSTGSDSRPIGGLGFADPPEHTRLRRLLTPEFTMRRLARLSRGSTRSSTTGSTRSGRRAPTVDLCRSSPSRYRPCHLRAARRPGRGPGPSAAQHRPVRLSAAGPDFDAVRRGRASPSATASPSSGSSRATA